MYAGKRVVAWVPYGRERTVSLLLPYLRRSIGEGVVDEVWLCENTDAGQDSDRAYLASVVNRTGSIRAVPMPVEPFGPRVTPKQLNTGRFPLLMQDPDTIFVRFDDDIIWVGERTIERMCDRVLTGERFAAFALIWNNAICSWWLQQEGRLSTDHGFASYSPVCPVAWGDPRFAVGLHCQVLDHLEAGDEAWVSLDADHLLPYGKQFSVSCFALSGSDYAEVGGILPAEEEHWHTQVRPGEVGRRNVVCGDAPVVHYSFMNQRRALDGFDILDRYRRLAEKVEAGL